MTPVPAIVVGLIHASRVKVVPVPISNSDSLVESTALEPVNVIAVSDVVAAAMT